MGGAGGSGTSDGGAANGGSPAVNPGSLTALVGGASSARHLDGLGDDLSLGGGGGAVTLISCHSNVSVAGTLSSGGGGGMPGGLFITAATAGQGGGAGGNVVLQGLIVEITGQVFANGGGGGGGEISGSTSHPGQDGSQSDSHRPMGVTRLTALVVVVRAASESRIPPVALIRQRQMRLPVAAAAALAFCRRTPRAV